MNNVIGPIPENTWGAMRRLRESVKFMANNNADLRYARALDKESALYNKFLKKVTNKEVN